MAEKNQEGQWITINGTHVLLEEGKTVEESMAKTFKKPVEETDKKIKTFKKADGKDVFTSVNDKRTGEVSVSYIPEYSEKVKVIKRNKNLNF